MYSNGYLNVRSEAAVAASVYVFLLPTILLKKESFPTLETENLNSF